MSWCAFIIVSCVKVLFIPSYKSTDFEVHRNWLAVTSSLPTAQWYTDTTSPWTLDYPPLFAWFEYLLSLAARHVDPDMLRLDNLDYSSWRTVLFQRLSVVVTDLVLFLGVRALAEALPRAGERHGGRHTRSSVLVWLVVSNAGLLMVDHVHFQYNGFLTGVLLLSLAALARDQVLRAAAWFSILLNLKHIYMYYAPAVGVYMLRSHCFQSARGGAIVWRSFSLLRLAGLGGVVLATTGISLGPFLHQLPQLLARLFPFRRGLCHAYWAPNVWTIYNLTDKTLAAAWRRLGWAAAGPTASMTAGLVQDIQHSVLPSVPPAAAALLTLTAMLPALAKLWSVPHSLTQFLRCLTLCAWSCFLLGWHVHEKAVLLVLVPLAVLATGSRQEARLYLVTAATAHFSLFPLLFQARELPTKVLLHLSHCLLAGHLLPHAAPLHLLERLYLALALPVFLYCDLLQPWLGLHASLPFLPLLLYSLYCSVGIITSYFRFYVHFLRS